MLRLVESYQFQVIGRSSSHFTRVVRLFADEVGVAYQLQVVGDLRSADASQYAGNPALRVPILKSPDGVWFGALGACRALSKASTAAASVVWPEDLEGPLLANAQELVLQTMSSEVSLIMLGLGDGESAYSSKLRAGLTGSMEWLEARIGEILAALPAQRDLSLLEITLFCLVRHLEFREVLPTKPYRELTAFCEHFGQRASARATPYRFD